MISEETYEIDEVPLYKKGDNYNASINDPTEVDQLTRADDNQTETDTVAVTKPKDGFFKRIRKYPTTFLFSLGLQYFNNGFKTIVTLAYLDAFKNYYNL